jgi:glucose/mannose-6-phosphate isomerase
MAPLLPDGAIDTLGVLDALLATPEAVATAAAAELDMPQPAGVHGTVLIASGADALVAEAALAIVQPWSPVPVFLHTGRDLPDFVSDEWRVIFVSRGATAEAHSALRAAADHRAVLTAVGSGEIVEEVAERDGVVVRCTDDVLAPRFSFAPTLVTLLRVLDGLGTLATPLEAEGLAEALDAAVDQLTRRRDLLDAPDGGDAAQLARRIGRTLLLVQGAGPVGAVAARRWAQQANTNAKVAAFASALPQLLHDQLAGWGQHGDVTRQVFSLVRLRHDHEHPDDAALVPLVDELVEEVVAARHEVQAEGAGPVAQLLDLVLVGDLVSWYLAQENEIDPGPVAVHDRLREK